MFKILDGRSAFDQWDLGQKVTNDAMVAGDRVRFASSNGETGITYARDDGGTIVADVPNELLKTANPIVVQLGGGASWQCEHKTTFAVNPAEMPEGYECTDNTYTPDPNACSGSGVTSWNDLEDRPFGEEVTERTLFDGDIYLHYDDVTGVYGISRSNVDLVELTQGMVLTIEGTISDYYGSNEEASNAESISTSVTVDAYGEAKIKTENHGTILFERTTGGYSAYIGGEIDDKHLKFKVTTDAVVTYPIDEKFLQESVKGGAGTTVAVISADTDTERLVELAKSCAPAFMYTETDYTPNAEDTSCNWQTLQQVIRYHAYRNTDECGDVWADGYTLQVTYLSTDSNHRSFKKTITEEQYNEIAAAWKAALS